MIRQNCAASLKTREVSSAENLKDYEPTSHGRDVLVLVCTAHVLPHLLACEQKASELIANFLATAKLKRRMPLKSLPDAHH